MDRAIADLEQSGPVLRRHIAEALIYRRNSALNDDIAAMRPVHSHPIKV